MTMEKKNVLTYLRRFTEPPCTWSYIYNIYRSPYGAMINFRPVNEQKINTEIVKSKTV